jgi:hypothetical protein
MNGPLDGPISATVGLTNPTNMNAEPNHNAPDTMWKKRKTTNGRSTSRALLGRPATPLTEPYGTTRPSCR